MRIAIATALLASGCGRRAFDVHDATMTDSGGIGDTSAGDAADGSVEDASISLCAGSTALVCEGFEQGYGPWNTSSGGGTVSLDTQRAFRGAQSVHLQVGPISTSTVNPRASLNTTQGLAGGTASGTLYARAWFYFASPHPTTEFDQLINFVEDSSGLGISVGTRNGMLVNNDYTSGSYKQSATTALPLDRWTCLQLEIPSGATGTARVFVDTTEVADIAIAKASAQPISTRIYVGTTWIGTIASLPASDTWVDEVVVDTSPITCAQ